MILDRRLCGRAAAHERHVEWRDNYNTLLICSGHARTGRGGRPPRRMPSLAKIAAFHEMGPVPHCYRCDFVPGDLFPEITAWSNAGPCLVRAHMIDRWADGLDNFANLYPLCHPCHNSQPIFKVGDEEAARAWFGVAA